MATKNRMGRSCFIVYCYVHLQDGHEEYVVLFNSVEKALEYINDATNNNVNGHNRDWHLFELGKEIPIEHEKKEVQIPAPPPVVQYVYSVKK